jgi:hypothetical protein
VTCDACDFEWIGATEHDAVNAGWSVRMLRGGRQFSLCAECEGHYQLLWALRESATSHR